MTSRPVFTTASTINFFLDIKLASNLESSRKIYIFSVIIPKDAFT